jgi:two-component system response regulator FlrC
MTDLPAVLLVEDDTALSQALSTTLELAGYPVRSATDGTDALAKLDEQLFGMVVTDVQMAPMNGHQLLRTLKAQHPELPVVIMTAYGAIDLAVDAMRNGAADYLVKPFDAELLVETVGRYMPARHALPAIVAEDAKTNRLAQLARRVAPSDATVMISGDSGTGKEVFARLIHSESKRAKGPFVAVNCAAIPENMLEASLFGYEKGAFTGAYQSRAGKFEQAQRGTLLLDEISEMDLALQAKLLRVLQEREVERLGGKEMIALDVRVLATTNRNLREEVAAGRFREDLFYRLNVFPLHLVPLRERRDDIVPLALQFIARYCDGARAAPQLTDAARERLLDHDWPGNVRELDNVIQRALILLAGDRLDAQDLVLEVVTADVPRNHEPQASPAPGGLGDDLKLREYQLILEALESDGGSRKAAAQRLGISPRTLRYKLAKMRELGLPVPA